MYPLSSKFGASNGPQGGGAAFLGPAPMGAPKGRLCAPKGAPAAPIGAPGAPAPQAPQAPLRRSLVVLGGCWLAPQALWVVPRSFGTYFTPPNLQGGLRPLAMFAPTPVSAGLGGELRYL